MARFPVAVEAPNKRAVRVVCKRVDDDNGILVDLHPAVHGAWDTDACPDKPHALLLYNVQGWQQQATHARTRQHDTRGAVARITPQYNRRHRRHRFHEPAMANNSLCLPSR